MRETEEIRRGLFNILEQKESVFQATVTAVNEEEFTCTVMVEKRVTYYNVRLRSIVNSELNGIALIPKTGSYVLVGRIGKSNELYICLFSEIDKIIFSNENINFTLDNESVKAQVKGTEIDIVETGIAIRNPDNNISCSLDSNSMKLDVKGNTIDISGSTISFNKGENGGLVKVEELTNKLNELIATFNQHTHTVPSGIIPVTAMEIYEGSNLTPLDILPTTNGCNDFSRGNYENINVQH